MKFTAVLILLATLSVTSGNSQKIHLKSATHGLDMIYKPGVTKQEVIEDIMFIDGKDNATNVVRIDNVGNTIGGNGPLVISSKKVIPSDSLGLTSIELSQDSLTSLLALVKRLDTGVKNRVYSEYVFRITYRFSGTTCQYYVSGTEDLTAYLKEIAMKIVNPNWKRNEERFYHFVMFSRLIRIESGSPQWTH